jgi:hypothetical protein
MKRNSVFYLLATYFLATAVTAAAQPSDKVARLGFLGFDAVASKLGGKRLELLKEIVPRLNLVAVLANPGNPNFQSVLKESQRAASILKLRLQVLEVRKPAMLGERSRQWLREAPKL